MTSNSIQKRLAKNKQALLDRFKTNPIVQIACKKTGISRATYYRWRKEDSQFAKQADTALVEGRRLINDMAESQLLSGIREKNMTAIIYWLNHNHPGYGNKVELVGRVHHTHEELSKEQKQLVKKALGLANVLEVSDEKP